MDWGLIWDRISSPDSAFWSALWLTIAISVVAQVIGIALGLLATFARNSRLRALRLLSGLYVLVFRGTPVLLQLFFFFAVLNLPRVVDLGVIDLKFQVIVAILALGINEGAYMREIIRAGIDSVDRGQSEAAKSLGMRRSLTMRRIVLPQAARVIVPPLGNEFNNMMKTSSLAYTIGVTELFANAQNEYADTFKWEYYVAVAFWYIALTTTWSLIQAMIERKLAVSERDQDVSLIERLREAWSPSGLWRTDAR